MWQSANQLCCQLCDPATAQLLTVLTGRNGQVRSHRVEYLELQQFFFDLNELRWFPHALSDFTKNQVRKPRPLAGQFAVEP